jgi:predicted RNase H-like HicB family nuclease
MVGNGMEANMESARILEEGELMDTYRFTVVIEPDEDAFHAYAPALPGCHTFGTTIDEARANIEEAVALHIESMLEDGEPVPIEREPLFITQLSIPVPA